MELLEVVWDHRHVHWVAAFLVYLPIAMTVLVLLVQLQQIRYYRRLFNDMPSMEDAQREAQEEWDHLFADDEVPF